jgi:hypothetical protein
MNDHYVRSIFLFGLLFIGAKTSAQWQPVGSGGNTYGIVAHAGDLYAGALGSPVRRSTDHGDTWTDVNTGITEPSNWCLASEQGALFCGTQFGAAFRSTDEGATWENIGLVGGARGFIEHNDTLYACQWYSGEVDYSSDGGATWQDTEPTGGLQGLWPMISVNGDLLVGGQSGGIRRITYSTDAWTASNTGLPVNEVYSFSLVGDILFAGLGSSSGVYRSDDFGATWTASGLSGNVVYALHAMDSLLFAGTYGGGVYQSADSGATWTTFNDGLSSPQVVRLTDDGVYLYAGTLSGGVYRYGITTGVDEVRTQTVGISAYPVPCHGSLTTSVRLSAAAELKVQLLDPTGKVVAEQRRGRMPAGTHLLTWNVDHLAPGLYGCLVAAGAQQGFVRVVVE